MSGICYVWVGFLIEKTPLKNTRGGVGARRLLAGIKTIRDQPTEQITFRMISQSIQNHKHFHMNVFHVFQVDVSLCELVTKMLQL